MNITDLMQSFFTSASIERLAQEADVPATEAQRILQSALPMQLDALADHARSAEGESQIADAIQNLPRFASIADALSGPNGASNLRQAGELLAPALLGGQAGSIAQRVTGSANPIGVQKLLHMALPLLLSFLGGRGLGMGSIAANLAGLKGSLSHLSGMGSTVTERVVISPTAGAVTTDAASTGTVAPAAALGSAALTADSLLEYLKAQLSGPAAERIGTAAGFSGKDASRATLAALPLILSGIINKARNENGAQDLLNRSGDFNRLLGADGHLNVSTLNDPAEVARIEGLGRNLFGSLFSNSDEITGRFASALGGSGMNAGRLLALLSPVVLALIAGRAKAGNLSAGGLGGLLGGLTGRLESLLPTGLAGLGSLWAAHTVADAKETTVVSAVPETRVVETVKPEPVAPAVVTPAPEPVTTERVVTAAEPKKGGFPWWLIPLILLAGLGGCYVLNKPKTETATTTTTQTTTTTTENTTTPDTAPVAGDTEEGFIVNNPASDANLPPKPFTMDGTAPTGLVGKDIVISDEGQEVARTKVNDDGTWSAEIPAPTVGLHTYTIADSDTEPGTKSEFKVNIVDEAAGADAAATETTTTETTTTTTTDTAAAGAFAISEPVADAELPYGGFTIKGTGPAGQEVQLYEDATSLGNFKIGDDGAWSFAVPSPTAGAHTYSVKTADGTELGKVATTIKAADPNAKADCTGKNFSISIGNFQTVSSPFRFGGVGNGKGYTVSVINNDRVVGTKDVALDASCGWSYQSNPGQGTFRYEVRPMGEKTGDPLGKVKLTIKP